MSQESLFSSFKEYNIEDWKALIIKDLKGGEFDSLYTKTPEGIAIAPIYHGYNTKLHNFQNPIQTEHDALPIRHWVNNALIHTLDEKTANTQALEALNSGADGIIFEIKNDTIDIALLLKDIKPAYCNISFKTARANYSLIQSFSDYLKSEKVDLKEVKGNYLFDPIEARDAGLLTLDDKVYQQIKKAIQLTNELPSFKVLHISGLLYHNAGANITHELSLLAAKSTEYFDKLTDLGLEANEIINATSFSMAFGSNYFMEIAKAKVLRMNLSKILSAYDQGIPPQAFKIIGYTSNRTKSALDFHVNLLRNTTETMSAVLAGCDEIYIAPHDEATANESKATFKRIALNISNILKEEAHLDKVADPTLGTYYLEELISSLEEKSWEGFLSLESQGGYQKIFESGTVKEIVSQDDKLSADGVVSRRKSYIGANMFQNIGEKLSLQKHTESNDVFLRAKRIGWKVENIRARTENHVNKHGESARPTASILKFGTDPVSNAKAEFAYSFLGMAGIKIKDEFIIRNTNEFSDALGKVNSSMVILCYQEAPKSLEEHLNSTKTKILIAGQEKSEDDLKSKGLYACINRNVEAYSFLQNLLNDLTIEG